MAVNDTVPTFEDTDTIALKKLSINFYQWITGTVPASSQGTLTASSTAATTNGSVAAGAQSVTFTAGAGTTVTVAGGALAAGASISFVAPPGFKLAAIPYTVSGGTLTILKLV